MNEQTQPTDAELLAAWDSYIGDPTAKLPLTNSDKLAFARAVLAKWGTPAGAGEPYAYAVYFPDQPTEELVHDLDDLCEDLTNREHVITNLYTTPQPTQAQAGAVPPPQYRVLEPRVDLIEADDEYLQDDAQTWATDPNGTFVGTIYGYALRAARRRIKGADHG